MALRFGKRGGTYLLKALTEYEEKYPYRYGIKESTGTDDVF